jgi:hypothetical protein
MDTSVSMIQMSHVLAGTGQDGMRFHHITQHGVQFKMNKLLISGICHLIFLDHG